MVTTVYTQLVNELPLILRGKLKQIKLIYLFGSQVTGFTSKTSDIDIAVLMEKNLIRY
jgi:predicted nucleotidyltransferase